MVYLGPMNVLSMGRPFGTDNWAVRLFRSRRGHEVRILAPDDAPDADYHFDVEEPAADVVRRISREWRPDLFICWLPEMHPPPPGIEHCPITTVAAVSDWNIYFAHLEYNLSRYDIVLTDRLGTQVLPLKGVRPQYCFPLYSQRTRLHRHLAIERDLDIVFVGNINHAIHARRARCLERLARLSDRYRIVIAEGYYEEAYARLLNRARIVFNHSLRREMNLRCFEALACGSLLFIEEGNLEVPDWLRDRREAVFYRPDNLVELLEYYLDHDDERERIARQGHAKAPALAGENRLDDLFDWLAAQPARGARAFRELPPVTQAYQNVLQYASSMDPGQRALAHKLVNEALARFPDRFEVLVAAACHNVSLLPHTEEAHRPEQLRRAVHLFSEALKRAPQAAAPMLDLALLSRQGRRPELEERFLRCALTAKSCRGGAVHLGTITDPYYVAWRWACALGKARIEILWAAAAARLAEICIAGDRVEEGRDLAAQAVAWLPEVARSHRLLAMAENRLGNPAKAVDILQDALPLTAFDGDYRMDLVRGLSALGRHSEAESLAEESARILAACEATAGAADEFRAVARRIAAARS